MFAYASTCVLRYADWAKDNEYPYLEKPERLEFPNETWAAQDMHKSEMFRAAAKLSSGTEREAYLERAQHFFDYSVNTLRDMRSSTVARTTVLMLSFGYAQAYCSTIGLPESANVEELTGEFGEPTRFISQKKRALRKLCLIAAAGAAISLAGLIYFVSTMT